jgi:SAM-dependent methyltransferase
MAAWFVAERGLGGVEVVTADARSTGLPPGSFDLVHARTLLVNLPEPGEVAAEMMRLARPGGWVASMEPDTEHALCYPPHPAFDRLRDIFTVAFRRNGADPWIGRRVPGLFRRAGLQQVEVEARVQMYPHGNSRRTIRLDLVQSMRPQVLEMGLATDTELDELDAAARAHLDDPDTVVMSGLLFLTWGRKPDHAPGDLLPACIAAGAQRAARSAAAYDRAVSEAPDYAFPHSAEDESRRLELLEQRLDPLTKRRIQRLGVGKSARCLEIGGGRGSITRWLSDVVGATGRVIATDLQLGFLSEIGASNVEVLRHDIRTGTFPPGSFDLIHTRAVLMHISPSVDLLRRIVTWLAPGGWVVLEEPDFGMWIGDADPVWAASPSSTQAAFPSMALSQGRSLLRQVHQLGLEDVGADAEIDIIQAGTDLAEFYQLSQAALALPKVQVGALGHEQATALIDRPGDDDFLACGFVHIGVWGRRPSTE